MLLWHRTRFRPGNAAFIQSRHPARTLLLAFLLAICVGGLLLGLPICSREAPQSWSTAFFTATSAVCVTGLVVVDTATTWTPFGQLVILLLIQVGGLGYMLASTLLFLIFRRDPALHDRLLLRETFGQITLRDTLQLALRAVRFTLAVELIGAIILTAHFMGEPERGFGEALWRGVFHSVSAFCNAGFYLFGQDVPGVAGLVVYQDDALVNFTVAALIIIGGLGFTVCQELWEFRRGTPRRPLSLHTRIVLFMTFWLVVGGTIILLATEWSNPKTFGPLSLPLKMMAAFFQSVTTRTAGFNTVDFGQLRSITLLVMGIFMFIGASPGGTGGGVKTTTFAVTGAAVNATLHGRPDIEITNRRIPTEVVLRALMLIFLSFTVIVAGMFILTFTEPTTLIQAGFRDNLFMKLQFEVLSAFGTVGVSTGITPHLTEAGRIVIMALMFIGRLGPTTVAMALSRRDAPPKHRMPSEKVSLG